MSWLFSQVLVEEYLGDISSDGEQSVQSSGNPTQLAYCAPDKMTVFSRLSRFGMTYKPLTEDRGEELLMSYLAAFPARTSLPQEKEQGLRESEAECGEKWRGWLAKYDPDSCSWRTAQCSLLEDSNECLETLPRSGMTANGRLWELPMLAHRTSGTESGLLEKWSTPTHYEDRTSIEQFQKRMELQGRTVEAAELSVQVRMNMAGLWRTSDTGAGGTSGLVKKGKTHRENGQPIQIRLVDQVNNPRLWPTPTASNAKNNGSASQMRRNTKPLDAEVGGALNPNWVEWLMGWPVGWTDLKPLETDKFQKWQDEHGRH